MKLKMNIRGIAITAATGLILAPTMIVLAPTAAYAQRGHGGGARHREAKMIAHEALRMKINADAPRRDRIDFKETKVRSIGRDRREVSGYGTFHSAERHGGIRRFSYHVVVNPITDRAVTVDYRVR